MQGESTLAGTSCTLVRLAGCPLRCVYCDTPRAIPAGSGKAMSIDDVVGDVRRRDRPLTLITGGEPLAQRGCLPLLEQLAAVSPIVQLETSGTYDISAVHPAIRRILDIKTPGSGEVERNRWQNLSYLKRGDEIKFVLTGREDYEWAVTCLQEYHLPRPDVPVLMAPAWEELASDELARWILEDRLPVRLQLQQHKYIWGADASGV
ncbi:MAG: radical SAM protein [Mariprofundaceae bacterium]|nr:radical SAM protein [Mariprofundaceae bacterium]